VFPAIVVECFAMADRPRSLPKLTLAACAVLTAAGGRAFAQDSERLPGTTIVGRPPSIEEPSGFPEFGGLTLGELPLSINVLRARELRSQGVNSLSEAIRRDPAASDAYNTVGYVESVQVRGFVLDGLLNYRRNGLPVSNFTPFNIATKQDIALLKGAAGPASGTGSPGGALNFLTKPATVDITELSVDVGERGSVTASADLGRRVGDDVGYRLNAAAWTREPAARDADGRGTVVAGAVDWRGRGGIRAEAEFEVQNSRQISVPGFGLLDADGDGVAETLPPPIDPRLNLNNQPWSQPFDNRSQVGTAKLVVPVADQWTVTLSGLLQQITTNDRLAFPDGCSSGPSYVYPGLCGNYDVDIYDYRSSNEERRTRVADVALDGQVRFAGTTHRLRIAPRTTRYSERYEPLQAYNYVGTINALAPVPLPEDPTPTSPNTLRDLRIDDVAVSDTIDLTASWRLFAGARLVRVEAASWRTDGSGELRFTQRETTPWLALAYTYAPNNTVYASFNRGFEVEAVPNRPTTFTNSGQLLPAAQSTQAEVGWRGSFAPDSYATVALFEIRRPQSDDRTVPADANGATLERVADGREARHRGIEFDWTWQFARQWSASVQAALLDAAFARTLDPALTGRRPTNVPEASGGLQLDWRQAASDGLTVSNRVNYSSDRAITRDNSVLLPSWWQWDAWLTAPARIGGAAAYWRAGIKNVTDRDYWREAPTQSWGGTYLFPAQPRTFYAGVSVML
jgi:iron complex outermembrane receptor protein